MVNWKILSSEQQKLDLDLFADFKSSESEKQRVLYFFSAENPFLAKAVFENLLLVDSENNIKARATLCYDGGNEGKIGFFHCVEDKRLFKFFIDSMLEKFKRRGFRKILAPMNFSSWFDYRFLRFQKPGILHDRELLLEPSNDLFYPGYFEAYGFGELKSYVTVLSGPEHFKTMIRNVGKLRELSESMDYQIRNFDLSKTESELKAMYHIFSIAFSKFPGMVQVNFDEFHYYISPLIPLIQPELIKFICEPDGTPVGVVAGFRTFPAEDIISVIYISCVSKKESFSGGALMCAFAQQMLDLNCEHLLVSLIADTSPILPFVKGTDIVRKYVLYEYDLK